MLEVLGSLILVAACHELLWLQHSFVLQHCWPAAPSFSESLSRSRKHAVPPMWLTAQSFSFRNCLQRTVPG